MNTFKEKSIRAVIADDQPAVRAALHLLLRRQTHIVTVGEAADSDELFLMLHEHQPDLALVDWELPGMPGVERVQLLRCQFPLLNIIILSGYPEAQSVALAAGAHAFVSKQESPEQLLTVLRQFLK